MSDANRRHQRTYRERLRAAGKARMQVVLDAGLIEDLGQLCAALSITKSEMIEDLVYDRLRIAEAAGILAPR